MSRPGMPTRPTRPSVYSNEYRRQAEVVSNRYTAELAAIDADRDLSVDGRTRRKQDAYQRANGEMQDLMHAERAEADERRREAQRRLFGLGPSSTSTDTISFRDAMDRASRLGLGETDDAMRRAIGSGDQALAKAILSRALEVGDDGSTARAYLAEFPEDQPLVEALSPQRSPLGLFAYMLTSPS